MSEEGSGRSYLPWIMAALVLTIGGAKLDAARPLVARGLALAIPLVPVLMAMKRLDGTDLRLERAAAVVGWLTIAAAELCVLSGIFRVSALQPLVPFSRYALYGAAAAALAVHTLEARRSNKPRFAAFIGMAAVFATYVSTHDGRDIFARVLGAFFVGLFVGGGAGLLAGELLARTFKKA
ncbi:MAG TPA: hypothetical protein VIW29_09240 [Polyangiaceae bacterium]